MIVLDQPEMAPVVFNGHFMRVKSTRIRSHDLPTGEHLARANYPFGSGSSRVGPSPVASTLGDLAAVASKLT